MAIGTQSESRERVFDTAERLFMERGYGAVTLKDIAQALQIRQASLYYHVPGGKEELFLRVTQRYLERQRRGLSDAVSGSSSVLTARLRAIADWFFANPPVNVARLLDTDIRELSNGDRRSIKDATYRSLMEPIARVFSEAQGRGEVRPLWPDLLATMYLSALEGMWTASRHLNGPSPADLVEDVIETLLNGMREGTSVPHAEA